MASTRLTEAQLAFFDTFGYLQLPGLLADSIDRVTEEFEAVWERHGGGHHGQEHDPTRRSCIVPFPDQSEYLSSLLDDPRLHDMMASVMGDDFNYIGGDGNLYAGDTGWHSDGWRPDGLLHTKTAFYLDPVTRDTGALRVIPGSHRTGDTYADTLQGGIGKSQELWGVKGDEVPAIALEVTPGDVVIFNWNLKHSAWGGSGRRRMFVFNCCSRYPEDRLPELQQMLTGSARFWVDRVYGEAMIRTAGPDRWVHLQQVRDNDFLVAERSRDMREKMEEPSRG